MNNIIRFWNQNRRGIIAGIIVIVLIIVAIQVLNEFVKKQNEKKLENTNTLTVEEKELPTESIITGQEVSMETTKSNVSIIEDFIKKCNNKDIDGAYALLTDDCKQVVFPTKQNFIDEYYNLIFSEKKSYSIDNYQNASSTYTYEVKYYNDLLSTGKISDNNYKDYITIDNKAENGKLNINNYIQSKQINKSSEKDGIIITVISKDIYQNYERYNVKIENKTDKTILVNTNKKLETINITTDENVKHGASITEISNALLKISPYISRIYNIKFNKTYNPNIDIQSISFEDIVTDYDKYINTPEEIEERVKIKINM